MALIHSVSGEAVRLLHEGWSLATTSASLCSTPREAANLSDWIPTTAPGTAAADLIRAGRTEAVQSLHEQDVWYRTKLPAGGPGRIKFDGLATIAEVWIGDARVLDQDSMFLPAEIEIDVQPGTTLWVCFRALLPRLAVKGPRARWRPHMVQHQGLRLVRTTLLGHMPSWCPPAPIVGPWRPVSLISPGAVRVQEANLHASWSPEGARLCVTLMLEGATEAPILHCAGASMRMQADHGRFTADVPVPDAKPWWPHTHGPQPLYPVSVTVGGVTIDLGRTGFRSVRLDRGADGRDFKLLVNDAPVFSRGACWMPYDLVALGGDRDSYEPTLRLAREAGMNMIRVPGVTVYESPAFFQLCDELGLMVWQDFMLANFDYPMGGELARQVAAEARAFLDRTQISPSLAVLCGGSEVMQQAGMMGLPTAEIDWSLYTRDLAGVVEEKRPDAAYVSNSPEGRPVPFAVDEGLSHYYGVGAYLRPLEDSRRANVKFASECLAFSNVPSTATLLRGLNDVAPRSAEWKARVPRDRAVDWDFEDVRDHYLQRLYGVDPSQLALTDPALYLDLSRLVTGEVMAAVFSEWRRAGSCTNGGLIWTLRDMRVGAGWGIIDALGEPKPCWYALKRVLQPVQVLLTDEGVNGMALHLLNETPEWFAGEIRLTLFSERDVVLEADREIELSPRSTQRVSAFDLIGRFYDVTHAYRFGPAAHIAVRGQLVQKGKVVSEVFHFLAPPAPQAAVDIAARIEQGPDGWVVILSSATLQRAVWLADANFRPADDALPLAPNEERRVALLRRSGALLDARPDGEVRVLGGALAARFGAPEDKILPRVRCAL